MSLSLSRRAFVKATGATALTLAAAPYMNAAEPERTITLAVVGCAHIHTPAYVRLLQGRADVLVKWVWDHDAARAQKSADLLRAKLPAKVADVWSDPEVQAAVILSETDRHRELVLAGAKAGKHLFVEKPLGINARESQAMADAIESAGVLFTTGYFMRTDPKHRFIKDEIAKGHFGKITRVRGSCCHSGSLDGWFDTEWRWMADRAQAGVGAFGDLGTHKLDILMWLLGDVEAVTADIRVITKRYGDCDESGEGLLRFKNTLVVGSLAAGWVAVDDPVQLLVSGTEGHATVFNGQLYYKSKHVAGAAGKEPWTQLPGETPLPLNQFVNAVAGSRDQPLVTVREAAARVTVMEAMYDASRGSKWVNL